MRRIILITTVAFTAGLFTVSQGLGAGEYGQDKVSDDVGIGQGMSGMDHGSSSGESRMNGMDKSVTAVKLDSKQIAEVQRLLKEKGHNPGAADGLMGPRTEKALTSFQEAQGLAATGKPTKETLRSLAPDTDTQEMLGLSPEFGRDQMQQDQMEQEPVRGPMKQKQMKQEPMQQDQTYEGGIDGASSPSEPTGAY